MDSARCQGVDRALFFPGPGDHKARAQALAICAGCPVKGQCLEWALELELPGIWGATSENQRKQLARAR